MNVIRYTNFYARAINTNHRDVFTHILNVDFDSKYPKYNRIRGCYYGHKCQLHEPFTTMIYDMTAYKSQYEERKPYLEVVERCISIFIKDLYKKRAYWFEDDSYPIIIVYDDDVHGSFGKELFEKTVIESFKQIFGQSFSKYEIQFKHIVNVIPGEVISMETDNARSIFALYSSFEEYYISPDLVKETQFINSSIQGNADNPYAIPYIQDKDIFEYGKKHDKYFISIDFSATHTSINTFLLHNRVVTLFDKKVLNIGFMNIVEWIHNKCNENSTEPIPIFKKFNNFISRIPAFGGDLTKVKFGEVSIDMEDYYLNSPIHEVTEACVNITNKIYLKHQFDQRVEIKYCIENVVEMSLRHIQLECVDFADGRWVDQDTYFSEDSSAMIRKYLTLYQARRGELMFSGDFESSILIDTKTKRGYFKLELNLKELGFEYSFEDLDA